MCSRRMEFGVSAVNALRMEEPLLLSGATKTFRFGGIWLLPATEAPSSFKGRDHWPKKRGVGASIRCNKRGRSRRAAERRFAKLSYFRQASLENIHRASLYRREASY